MKAYQHEVQLRTAGGLTVTDITEDVLEAVRASGVRDGICCVYSPHTTCSVRVNEFETGFLEDMEVARLLAAADAVVLPYRVGGGPWNTSLHAALLQGTFVLATSNERSGYDPRQNLHWARPRDLDEFRAALEKYAGVRKDDKTAEELPPTWETVVSRHEEVYRARLGA